MAKTPRRCRRCGQPVWLVPLLGWVHVSMFDNLDCEAEV